MDQLAEAGRQYEELKSAFKLKSRFDAYEIVGGRVMTRRSVPGLMFFALMLDQETVFESPKPCLMPWLTPNPIGRSPDGHGSCFGQGFTAPP